MFVRELVIFNSYITIIMAFQGQNTATTVNMVALMRSGKASLFQYTVFSLRTHRHTHTLLKIAGSCRYFSP